VYEEIKGIAAMLLYMLRAVEPLKQSLTNPDARIRRESAWALGEIKDFSSKDVLIQACQDSEVEVRQAAKEALVKLITEFGDQIFLAL
jgi:HEAT repeat protein